MLANKKESPLAKCFESGETFSFFSGFKVVHEALGGFQDIDYS